MVDSGDTKEGCWRKDREEDPGLRCTLDDE